MRLIMQEATVTIQEGLLQQVRTPKHTYQVAEVLRHWMHGGRWWRGEYPRHYYLIRTKEGILMEIFEEVMVWHVSAIQD